MTKLYDDYCSKEVTDLLKEKGFKCGATYSKGFVKDRDGFVGGLVRHENKITHQLAMKWLREEKGIYVYVEPYMVGGTYIDELEVHYCGRILDSNRRRLHSIENMTSYPEAIEERIKYSLVNLI